MVTHTHTRTHTHTHTHTHIRIYIYIRMYIYIHTGIWTVGPRRHIKNEKSYRKKTRICREWDLDSLDLETHKEWAEKEKGARHCELTGVFYFLFFYFLFFRGIWTVWTSKHTKNGRKRSSSWRDFWRPGGSKPKPRGIFLFSMY